MFANRVEKISFQAECDLPPTRDGSRVRRTVAGVLMRRPTTACRVPCAAICWRAEADHHGHLSTMDNGIRYEMERVRPSASDRRCYLSCVRARRPAAASLINRPARARPALKNLRHPLATHLSIAARANKSRRFGRTGSRTSTQKRAICATHTKLPGGSRRDW